MKLELIKILDQMLELYEMPRTRERFDKYLFMLQGQEKNEMLMPIASFNPMGKELVLEKLKVLMELKAEDLLGKVISEFNEVSSNAEKSNRIIRIALNLVDDIEGSWSNFFAVDYKSKFEIGHLIKRNFCTPIFWTSEVITEEIIIRRIEAYVSRTKYWIVHGKPKILRDMFEQEVVVQMNTNITDQTISETEATFLQRYLKVNQSSEDYSLNLNFFYGDEASKDLNYKRHGIMRRGGFMLVKYVAAQRKRSSH